MSDGVEREFTDEEIPARDEVRLHLTVSREQFRGMSREQVRQAVRDRFTAAGLPHTPWHEVYANTELILKDLYGDQVTDHVGADMDGQAHQAAVGRAINAVRKDRRGKSRQQLTAELGEHLQRAGFSPLLPPTVLTPLLAGLTGPVLPVRALDGALFSARVTASHLHRYVDLVRAFRSTADDRDDRDDPEPPPSTRS